MNKKLLKNMLLLGVAVSLCAGLSLFLVSTLMHVILFSLFVFVIYGFSCACCYAKNRKHVGAFQEADLNDCYFICGLYSLFFIMIGLFALPRLTGGSELLLWLLLWQVSCVYIVSRFGDVVIKKYVLPTLMFAVQSEINKTPNIKE
ncbi:MAG: hypothetical protein FWB93_03395 [Oscillospiraceae bacterium]|nr:hypothetical protein [Oscillospiraceae bacterium]